jgi:hypothetical protein
LWQPKGMLPLSMDPLSTGPPLWWPRSWSGYGNVRWLWEIDNFFIIYQMCNPPKQYAQSRWQSVPLVVLSYKHWRSLRARQWHAPLVNLCASHLCGHLVKHGVCSNRPCALTQQGVGRQACKPPQEKQGSMVSAKSIELENMGPNSSGTSRIEVCSIRTWLCTLQIDGCMCY